MGDDRKWVWSPEFKDYYTYRRGDALGEPVWGKDYLVNNAGCTLIYIEDPFSSIMDTHRPLFEQRDQYFEYLEALELGGRYEDRMFELLKASWVRIKLPKVRKGLPLCFSTKTGAQEIMTRYDTGTLDNHISLELAEQLDYSIDYSPESQGQFRMANGKTITAMGRITADVAFSENSQEDKITCYFNVFRTLAHPVLIGMAFLHATETLSRHTFRLVNLLDDIGRSLRLCAVGEATNQVQCLINGMPVTAHADTGADIALMSADFARRNRLVLTKNCEEIMLADGSIDYTSGFADVILQPKEDPSSRVVRVHMLKDLQFDVLLDESIVDDFELFKNKAYSLIDGMMEIIPSIAPIIHLGSKLERGLANATDKFKDWTSNLFTSKKQTNSALTGSEQGASEGDLEAERREKMKNELLQRINDLVQERTRHQLWASKQSFTEAQERSETDKRLKYDADLASLRRELASQ